MSAVKAPRGTHDVLPCDSYKWRYVERAADKTAFSAGYKEIRFPTFEETELFQRGVGDTTDIVQKEMYTFTDKGDRSLTLRPEGTASSVRLCVENGLLTAMLPVKSYYKITAFRYEKPQQGRYREFNQFGMELYGATAPAADAEIIGLAEDFVSSLGIKGAKLKINSIGCPECRKDYHKALKEYFGRYNDELCETCNGRLERNPMRILDCKSPVCKKICEGAPVITDFLCADCRAHYEELKRLLDGCGITYEEDSGIVRGLDYYTRTVFELIHEKTGLALLAGGRYDGLVEEIDGKLSVPGIGFASGLERLVAVMEDEELSFGEDPSTDLYIASIGENALRFSSALAGKLRGCGINVETDIMARSLKAQLKYADKTGAAFSVVIGDSETENGTAELRNMKTGEKINVKLGTEIADVIKRSKLAD